MYVPEAHFERLEAPYRETTTYTMNPAYLSDVDEVFYNAVMGSRPSGESGPTTSSKEVQANPGI